MHQPPIEALLERIGKRFTMVNAVAARAEQLIRGDIPAIETTTRNPVLVAMEELALGKFHIVARRSPGNDAAVTESASSSNGPFADEKRAVAAGA
ncbi:MAG: DNA-directed RNA polymerase subunit omega [bacterium]